MLETDTVFKACQVFKIFSFPNFMCLKFTVSMTPRYTSSTWILRLGSYMLSLNHEISGKNFVIYPNITESKYDSINSHSGVIS